MVNYKYTKKDYYRKYLDATNRLADLEDGLKHFDPTINTVQQRHILNSICYSFCKLEQYVLDLCETYLVSNDLFPNDDLTGIELVKTVAEECKEFAKYESLFVNVVKLRNSDTHSYYIDDYVQSIINLLTNNLEEFKSGIKLLTDNVCKPSISKEMPRTLKNFRIKK